MSASFVKLSVRRPVLITVIYLVVLVIGAFSLMRLPIDLMPEITYPTITVVTSYGNTGPQEMEELVSRPIEAAIAGLQGIEEITSTSSEGRSTVRVSFVWGTDLDVAVNDIRDRIDRSLNSLPEDIERPFIRKFDLNAFPVMILGVTSDKELTEIRQIVEDQVLYRLERVEGVASVDIRGGTGREIQVSLRSSSMEAFGISTDMVVSALNQENRNIPAGSVDQGNREIMVRTLAEFEGVDDVRNTIVAVRNGAAVRISDIAEVTDGYEEVTNIVRINGTPGIQLSVSKQSGTNTVAVANGVHRELSRINRDISGFDIIPLIDTSKYIERSIGAVANALLIGGAIALLVLLLFLRNISTTLIISVAIPISIIATFALVYFSGLTLNLMTFGGLALGIGMLLDNAIVVLDNIYHKRENGEEAEASAVKGAGEVWSAVTASTLTTLVVFFPVVFIQGMSGIMFRSLAYVVAFSLACSLLVALTLVPMLSSKFLYTRNLSQSKSGLFSSVFRRSESFYIAVEHQYGRLIHWALRHRPTVIMSVAALFILALLALPLVGVEFMPSADESEVRVNVEMEVGTKLERLDEVVKTVEGIIKKEVPECEYIVAMVGGGGWWSSNHTANMRVALVPKNQRSRSSAKVAQQLRPKLMGIPGASIRVREGRGLFIFRIGTSQDQSLDVEIRGHDLKTGRLLAQQLSDAILQVEGVTEADISREEGMPEYRVKIDRGKAADLGLTANQIGSTVRTAMGGTRATQVRVSGKEYSVIVRLAQEDRKKIDQLYRLSVLNKTGTAVSLQSVADVEPATGPTEVQRRDRERVVSINVDYDGVDLKTIVERIREALKDISVPQEFAVLIRGDWEEQQKSQREMMFGIAMAILLVFLVMAGQFESFKDPFIVLFSIPVALVGVVAIMLLTGTPFTVQAYIGCIILAGIVVNNAIVLVDTVNRFRREEGMGLFKALETAGERRLRPILMTTLTTSLGLLPLAIGMGEGGETQAPMARVVIGGLSVSTMITLVFIPVIYSIVEQRKEKKMKLEGKRA
ncbi:MAG: efflux RND transporter permease subunit [Chitinispirillaceae bacterium]